MGTYTELVLKCRVKEDLPKDVEDVLNFMFNNGDTPDIIPEHMFFKTQRWELIGKCSSYYHIPWAVSAYRGRYIFSRSDIKNYDHEIQLFIDWISKYLDCCHETCIGWIWYEEDDSPTLLYKK